MDNYKKEEKKKDYAGVLALEMKFKLKYK